MPDLMNHEFRQIHEAIDIAADLLSDEPTFLDYHQDQLQEINEKIQKVRRAKELMADLAGGNSR